MSAYDELRAHIAAYNDLLNILNLMKWDMRTQMPPGGATTRGQQMATLNKMAKELFASDKTARLLDAAEAEWHGAPAASYQARAIQQTRHYYEIQRRIPSDVVGAIAELTPESEHAWARARQEDDFSAFAPYLQKMLDLNKALADAIGYEDHPYDALVYEYEPSMNAARLRTLFDGLRAGLLPLLERIQAQGQLEHDLWQKRYPVEQQKAFALSIAEKFGYDMNRGRLDIAPHPFEISFTRQDVRITTRYDEHFLPMALFGTLHETGHALYEQNISPDLTRSALTTDFLGQYAVGGTSYGAHEFSSRLWENQIGRSRAFWQVHFDALRAIFPEQLAQADADTFFRAVNRVEPSLIRVEADEVTYNLHIMVRVEIELGLLEGSMAVTDLPEVWNAKMQAYLGTTPPNNRLGVLQDVHWSGGGFGSFPGYTIGNVMSAQVLAAARAQVPTLDEALAVGDYAPLLDWLREHIYTHGRAYDVNELLERVSGQALHLEPYLAYLNSKFEDVYSL